ncbi:MAG: ABC transporter ATP-binding protein [Planctomycetes bacterium]|nr:ABC transporter ATP-binding protein [Planctomycetota bacterium]
MSMEEMRSPMEIVRFERVGRDFGPGSVPLQEIDLTVQAGQIVVIMGPSGSGKTTLLRLIAGLDSPTSGRIWIGGEASASVPAWRRGVAMVFQQPVLMPHLTARQQMLASWRSTRSKTEPGVALDSVVELLEVASLLDRRPGELSGGERQRIAVGRALVRAARLTLLDEPFSSLDLLLRRRLEQRLRVWLRSRGLAAVLVAHELSELHFHADQLVLMRDGRVEQHGTLRELRQTPCAPFVDAWCTALCARFEPDDAVPKT